MERDVEALFRPPAEPVRKRFPVRTWYVDVAVSENLSLLPDAIDYYDRAVSDGRQYIVPKGDLQDLLAGQAGIVHFYETFLNDAAKIIKWLEEKLRRAKANRYVFLLSEDGQRQYGKLRLDDMDSYVCIGKEVEDLTDNLMLLRAAHLDLQTLVERLTDRGIKISLISKLREAGQTEIFIDASQATPYGD